MNSVVECAAAHVAKLFSGEMSEQDLRRLETWLAEDERHRTEYEAILEAWDLVEGYCPELEIDTDNQELKNTSRSPRMAYKIAAGFGAVAIALSAYFLTGYDLKSNHTPGTVYETAVGEQRTVLLADNSTITLNTGTKIYVDFEEGKRHLELAFGEAFFDIEKDPSRPFVIDFGDRQITVLGTKFNVLLAPSVSTVSVIEGLVSVRDSIRSGMQALPEAFASVKIDANLDTDEVLLKAGKSAAFSAHEMDKGAVVKTDINEFQDWRLGQVRFDSETLIKVVAELNRYSYHKVLIEDSTVVDLEVSGVFQLDKFDQFLQGIDKVLPVDVIRYSDRYVIVGSGQQAKSEKGTTPSGP